MTSLEAILADPDDDGPRAVHADELAERGDPRGELIQVQLRLAQLDPEADEHPALLARSDRLLAEHGAGWFGGLTHDRFRVRRGFVEAMAPRGAEAEERFVALAGQEPIAELEIDELPEPSPATRRLRELRTSETIVPGLLRALRVIAPGLRRLGGWLETSDETFELLEGLALDGLDVSALDDPAIARVWTLRLASLRLIANVDLELPGPFGGRRLDLTGGDLPTLLAGVELAQLTIIGKQLSRLGAWPGLARLPRLAFHSFWPTQAKLLARTPLDALRELELAHDLKPIGGAELAALGGAPWAARLRVLRLHMEVDDPDALVQMVRQMPRLTTLQVRGLDAETIARLRGPRLVRVGEAHRRYELDWTETSR